MQARARAGIKRVLNTVIHRSASVAARVPLLQGPIFAAYARLPPDGPWMRKHPFDRQFATDTSGFLPTWPLRSGLSSNRHGYATPAAIPAASARRWTPSPTSPPAASSTWAAARAGC